MKYLAALILLSLFASCSTLSLQDMASLQKDLGIQKLPDRADYPDADAVMILDKTDVKMVIDRNYNFHTITDFHRVKEVFKDVADESSVEIKLYHGEKLLEITARTIEPDGKVIPLKQTDFYTISGGSEGGSVFYTDIKTVKFTFPAAERGSILEYAYEEENDLPFVTDVWEIQRYMPVMRNIYTLTVPSILMDPRALGGAGWKWNFRTYNYTKIGQPVFDRPLNTEGLERTEDETFTWKLDSIPAFEPEPGMPPDDWFRGYVKFAPSDWKTWDDISKWYYNDLFKPRLEMTDAIKKESEKLTAGDTSEVGKMSDIFRYVQAIRYTAVELGIGGLQPDFPQTVLDRQYGDCKDKAILLVSLLEAAGIPARPVLVLTKSEGHLDPTFPCWRFNHMIVRVDTPDGSTFWLDPTVRYCRLGEIPSEDEGVVVLVLNDDGTSLLDRTPSSQVWDNGVFIDIKADIHSHSMSKFHVTVRFEGEEDLAMRNALADATPKEIRNYCKAMIVNTFVDSKLTDYTMCPVDSLSTYFNLSFDFDVPNLVQRQSDLYFLHVDPFPTMRDLGWLSRDKRRYPVQFDYPYIMRKRVDVTVDSGYVVRDLPSQAEMKTPDFEYSSSYSNKTPSHILFNEVFSVKSRVLPVQNYEAAKDFFNKVKKQDESPVVLVTK